MSTAPPPIDSAKLGPADSKASPLGNLLRLLNQQETVLFVAFCVVFGWVGSVNHGFLEFSNFVDMLYNCSYIEVAAIGMTMIILCGHIDLFMGAAFGFCARVEGKLAVGGVRLAIVFPAIFLAGGIMGLINGLLVAYGRIPAIVTTLGM